MDWLAIFGGVLVAAGLVGLTWCMWRGARIHRERLPDAETIQKLKPLIPLNLASVAAAALGLGMLAVYFILG
jgi:hypothetical protein